MFINGKQTKFKKKIFYKTDKTIEIEIKFVFDHKLKKLDKMFFGCNFKSIKFVNVDTSLVKSMEDMFTGCYDLKSVDLTCFNTKNVKNMTRLFFCCSNLLEVDLSSFDFTNVEEMILIDGRSSIQKVILRKDKNKEKVKKNICTKNIIFK